MRSSRSCGFVGSAGRHGHEVGADQKGPLLVTARAEQRPQASIGSPRSINMEAGELRRAEFHLREATRLKPTYYDAWYNLCCVETSMPGVFAAGDLRQDSTKQAASAAGEGATAALMIREYLNEH